MNDYTTVGCYYSGSGTNTQSLLNLPDADGNLGAMLLEVMPFNGYAENILQRMTVNGGPLMRVFLRRYLGGTWSKWMEYNLSILE